MTKFGIISIFPQMFDSWLSFGVTSRAIKRKLIDCVFFNPRDYTEDNYKTIDDRPFGGGPGMVMLYEPLAKAIFHAKEQLGQNSKVIYLSPQGKTLNQEMVKSFSQIEENIILLCGRYEGIDERIIEEFVDGEISIGDYVLSGGEIAAFTLIDAIARLIPGALGDELSFQEDSFFDGLLDCPHYTRPQTILSGKTVPDVLVGGNHAEIKRWRDMMRLGRTNERRPDLIKRRCLSDDEKKLLKAYEVFKAKKENNR